MPVQLQPGEVLLLQSRKHWVYLYPLLALHLLALAVPVTIALWAIGQFDLEGLGRTVVLVLAGVWALYWGVRAYFVWYAYHHDFWMITNQRLVDSQRRHWFHQEIASADLVDVQDTSVERNGVLQTVLNFGDLLCQTAGQQLNFVLHGIPNPVSVLTTLDHARDEARREASTGRAPVAEV